MANTFVSERNVVQSKMPTKQVETAIPKEPVCARHPTVLGIRTGVITRKRVESLVLLQVDDQAFYARESYEIEGERRSTTHKHDVVMALAALRHRSFTRRFRCTSVSAT